MKWLTSLLFLLALAGISLPSNAAVVLLYHHVSTATPKSTSISPEAFEGQMDYLASNGFKVVPLTTLVEQLRTGKPLADKTVAISFDDSYKSVFESAYPRLKKRGWPFTFFVNTDAVGSGKSFVTWDQLREMARHGATIANHTSTHDHLPRKKPGESVAELRKRIAQDIEKAQRRIQQEIGSAPMMLAYPFGEYDPNVQVVAKQLGYVAFGQQSGPLHEKGDLQAVPRFPFGGRYTELNDFIMKVNTKPMPVQNVSFYRDRNHALGTTTVRAGDQPWLVLEFADEQPMPTLSCFVTAQGAAHIQAVGRKVWVQASKALTPGRTRYNCTAPSGEKGRFYWYTQQWLVTGADGKWVHGD